MTAIPFTQYVLPHGTTRTIFICRPPEVMAKAFKLIEAGYVFEVEILSTGEVSLSIHDPSTEEDVDMEFANNGPEVPEAVDRMVERLHKKIFTE